jgi:PIN domain nuclease of toxin-antitoxin system
MSAVVLDSCTWVWLASDRARISSPAAEAIARARSVREAHVSVISCWEVAKLVEKGRLAFRIPVDEWIRRALSLEGIVLNPLTPDICVRSTDLPKGLDGDPADQIIVATAREMGAVLVTPDTRMRDYPHVPTIW